MPDIIVPTATQETSWTDLRKGLRDCIKSATTNARVYSRWPLKYDIGKTTTLLKSNADGGRIHSWIISVGKAEPFNDKAGSNNSMRWNLTIKIWGFLGYAFGEDDDNTQNELEEEARNVARTIFVNKKHLGLVNTQGIGEVGFLVFNDIDVHGFGEDDVHIAQGELNVTLNEFYV